jgi:hypothetical protein
METLSNVYKSLNKILGTSIIKYYYVSTCCIYVCITCVKLISIVYAGVH